MLCDKTTKLDKVVYNSVTPRTLVGAPPLSCTYFIGGRVCSEAVSVRCALPPAFPAWPTGLRKRDALETARNFLFNLRRYLDMIFFNVIV